VTRPVPPCANTEIDLWFQRDDESNGSWQVRQQAAVAFCRNACSPATREACLEQALRHPACKQFGVVGATTAGQRRDILTARRAEQRRAAA